MDYRRRLMQSEDERMEQLECEDPDRARWEKEQAIIEALVPREHRHLMKDSAGFRYAIDSLVQQFLPTYVEGLVSRATSEAQQARERMHRLMETI